jgi:asparaginyl-tRNA synthetase
METTLVKKLYRETESYADKTVKISGWIRTLRASNAFGFIEMNDGSFFKNVQIVFEQDIENFKEIAKYPISTSISVEGTVALTPDAKQPFEIKASKITLEGNSNSDYPLHKKKHSLEYLRTIAHV